MYISMYVHFSCLFLHLLMTTQAVLHNDLLYKYEFCFIPATQQVNKTVKYKNISANFRPIYRRTTS